MASIKRRPGGIPSVAAALIADRVSGVTSAQMKELDPRHAPSAITTRNLAMSIAQAIFDQLLDNAITVTPGTLTAGGDPVTGAGGVEFE